ncbi:hypothetical protein ACX80N_14665 [Arthrobacter sp. MDT2-16]
MTWRARLGATALAAILLAACASPGGPGSGTASGTAHGPIDPAGTSAPGAPPADGEVIAEGTVLQIDDGLPQLCLGGVMESYPPQCSGPPIMNWDWDLAGGSETASGVTWGAYAVTGTWDGTTFTRTGVPISLALYDRAPITDPMAGRQGTTGQAELDRILQDIYFRHAGYTVTAGIERGFVVVTVIHDDGSFQERMDAEYGQDVVVVLSALRSHG